MIVNYSIIYSRINDINLNDTSVHQYDGLSNRVQRCYCKDSPVKTKLSEDWSDRISPNIECSHKSSTRNRQVNWGEPGVATLFLPDRKSDLYILLTARRAVLNVTHSLLPKTVRDQHQNDGEMQPMQKYLECQGGMSTMHQKGSPTF